MLLDWEVYRTLYRASDCPVWKAASHPDLVEIARATGSTKTTVWRRMREWRRVGFLIGHEILPHPALLGVGLNAFEVRLSDPKARVRFLNDLELIDGIFVANFSLGPRTMVLAIADSAASQTRRARLIERIPGVEEILPSRTVWLPPPPSRLATKAWRLISELRENPDDSFAHLAGRLGITPKTFSRRYQALRTSNAILTYRVEDFSKFPGTVATLQIGLAAGADSRAVARRVEERLPGLLELVFIDRRPYAPHDRLGYSTLVTTVSSVEAVEAEVLEVSNVSGVRTIFVGGERAYRGWFDERVSQILRAAS